MADVPFRLREPRAAPSPGWPPDVNPNQIIFASHINTIRDSVARWPGNVDGQNHTLANVNLVNVTGVMTDPTTTAGDLIVHGASVIERLPAGATGQVLTVDTALPSKLKWVSLAPAGVSSVYGRTGAVVAAVGDYTAAQVTNAADRSQVYTNPSWIGSLAYNKLTSVPASFPPSPHQHDAGDVITGVFPPTRLGTGAADTSVFLRGDGHWAPAGSGGAVASVFGRTGGVVALTGDYSVGQVTGALADVTSTRGDLITRSAAGVTRLPAGGDGQVLQSDSTSPSGLKWAVVSGSWVDPTSAKGDLLVRDASNITRLGVGPDTYVLTADSSAPTGVKWAAAAGGAGAVASVFGRTGAVVAQTGDYTADKVTNAADMTASYANPAWITSLGWSKITGAPAFVTDPTTSKGDLLARGASSLARLPVGADGFVLVADAAQILGVKWAPAAGGGGTPAGSTGQVQYNNAGAFGASANLSWDNANGRLGIGTASPQSLLALDKQYGASGLLEAADFSFTANDGAGNRWFSGAIVGYVAAGAANSTGSYPGGLLFKTKPIGSISAVPATRMVLDSLGNLGIGTTSPASQLVVSGVGQTVTNVNTAGALGGCLIVDDAGGSSGNGGMILFSFANQVGRFAAIKAFVQDGGGNSMGDLTFATRRSTADATLTESMRITFGGKVGIGLNPSYKLDVAGDINIPTGSVYRINGNPIGGGGGVTAQNSYTTAQRVSGTAYQNSSGKPMFVLVNATINGGYSLYAYTDSSATPSTMVAQPTNGVGSPMGLQVGFWVLPGNWYKVIVQNGSQLSWFEWT